MRVGIARSLTVPVCKRGLRTVSHVLRKEVGEMLENKGWG
jgi:hypothetical protein